MERGDGAADSDDDERNLALAIAASLAGSVSAAAGPGADADASASGEGPPPANAAEAAPAPAAADVDADEAFARALAVEDDEAIARALAEQGDEPPAAAEPVGVGGGGGGAPSHPPSAASAASADGGDDVRADGSVVKTATVNMNSFIPNLLQSFGRKLGPDPAAAAVAASALAAARAARGSPPTPLSEPPPSSSSSTHDFTAADPPSAGASYQARAPAPLRLRRGTVFLSHTQVPAGDATLALREALAAAGVCAWFDQDVSGGATGESMRAGVEACELFCIVLAHGTLGSAACQLELAAAVEMRRPLLALRCDDGVSAAVVRAEGEAFAAQAAVRGLPHASVEDVDRLLVSMPPQQVTLLSRGGALCNEAVEIIVGRLLALGGAAAAAIEPPSRLQRARGSFFFLRRPRGADQVQRCGRGATPVDVLLLGRPHSHFLEFLSVALRAACPAMRVAVHDAGAPLPAPPPDAVVVLLANGVFVECPAAAEAMAIVLQQQQQQHARRVTETEKSATATAPPLSLHLLWERDVRRHGLHTFPDVIAQTPHCARSAYAVITAEPVERDVEKRTILLRRLLLSLNAVPWPAGGEALPPPPPPPGFVPSFAAGNIAAVRDALQSSRVVIAGGPGGLGKSSLGAALSRDEAILMQFEHVFWLYVGRSATRRSLRDAALRLLRALSVGRGGGSQGAAATAAAVDAATAFDVGANDAASLDELAATVRAALAGRAVLIIADDVSGAPALQGEHARFFASLVTNLLPRSDAAGASAAAEEEDEEEKETSASCRLLITTRDADACRDAIAASRGGAAISASARASAVPRGAASSLGLVSLVQVRPLDRAASAAFLRRALGGGGALRLSASEAVEAGPSASAAVGAGSVEAALLELADAAAGSPYALQIVAAGLRDDLGRPDLSLVAASHLTASAALVSARRRLLDAATPHASPPPSAAASSGGGVGGGGVGGIDHAATTVSATGVIADAAAGVHAAVSSALSHIFTAPQRACFAALGVFEPREDAPISLLAACWARSAGGALALVDAFARAALLVRKRSQAGGAQGARVQVHDLVHESARGALCAVPGRSAASYHAALLQGALFLAQQGMRRKERGKGGGGGGGVPLSTPEWWEVVSAPPPPIGDRVDAGEGSGGDADDGSPVLSPSAFAAGRGAEEAMLPLDDAARAYLLKALPFHLRSAGRAEEAHALLFRLPWLAAVLRARGIGELIYDVLEALESCEEAVVGFGRAGESAAAGDAVEAGGAGAVSPRRHEHSPPPRRQLQLLLQTLRLSAPGLQAGPMATERLVAQLVGRLRPFASDSTESAPAGSPIILLLEEALGFAGSAVAAAASAASAPPTPSPSASPSSSAEPPLPHAASAPAAPPAKTAAPGGCWLMPVSDRLLPPIESLFATLSGHSDSIRGVCSLGGGRLASASDDATVRVWDLSTTECLRTLVGHTKGVESVCVVGVDGSRLASGGKDGDIRVWDVATGDCLRILNLEKTLWIRGLCALGEGPLFVSAEWRGGLIVWDADSGEATRAVVPHKHAANAICSLGNGLVASASRDMTCAIWDVHAAPLLADNKMDEPTKPRRLRGHTKSVLACCGVDGGRYLASASEDCTVRVWDVASGAHLVTLRGERPFNGVCDIGDRRIAATCDDSHVRIFDLNDLLHVLQLLQEGRGAHLDRSSSLEVKQLILRGHGDSAQGLCSIDGGRSFASTSWDQTIKVWRNHLPPKPAAFDEGAASGGALPSEGSAAAAPLQPLKKAVSIPVPALPPSSRHDDYIMGVVAIPGDCLVSCAMDGTVRVWDALTGGHLRTLRGHTKWVIGLCSLLDGRVVSAGADEALCVWDAHSGERLVRLTDVGGNIGTVYCIDGGARFGAALSVSAPFPIGTSMLFRVWDAETFEVLETMDADSPRARELKRPPPPEVLLPRLVTGSPFAIYDSSPIFLDADVDFASPPIYDARTGHEVVCVFTAARVCHALALYPSRAAAGGAHWTLGAPLPAVFPPPRPELGEVEPMDTILLLAAKNPGLGKRLQKNFAAYFDGPQRRNPWGGEKGGGRGGGRGGRLAPRDAGSMVVTMALPHRVVLVEIYIPMVSLKSRSNGPRKGFV